MTASVAQEVLAFSARRLVYNIRYGLFLALCLMALAALLMCLMRPEGDFARARMTKRFWTGALAASLVVIAWPYLIPLYLPFGGILQWVGVIATLYYLGPERQRMGRSSFFRRGRRRDDDSRGGW